MQFPRQKPLNVKLCCSCDAFPFCFLRVKPHPAAALFTQLHWIFTHQGGAAQWTLSGRYIQAFRNDTCARTKSQPCAHKHCLVYHCLFLPLLAFFPLTLSESDSVLQWIHLLRGDPTQALETWRGGHAEIGLLRGKRGFYEEFFSDIRQNLHLRFLNSEPEKITVYITKRLTQ